MPEGSITRWWWIRHAPAAARPGEILGRLDPPADLERAGDALGELSLRLPQDAAWITSGARRCCETAEALAAARGRVPAMLVEPDLIEQDFGGWQGLTHEEAAARDRDAAARFWRSPALEAPPGGESFADMLQRAAGAIERLAQRHAGDLVLIAHAGTVRAAIAQALGIDAAAALRIAVDPLSLTRLDRFPPASEGVAAPWRVVAVNVPPGGMQAFAES